MSVLPNNALSFAGSLPAARRHVNAERRSKVKVRKKRTLSPKGARVVSRAFLGLPEARYYLGCNGHMHVFRRIGYRSDGYLEDRLIVALAGIASGKGGER
ncbi:hypothetical protein [Hylemonella gracilis]|uniref:hypothetical protein n=1 Tax=Hylemonella gracilis TaxID=80880 RepID=UPI0012DEF8C2|nr:hypothetical protein [Hylemonella gracilis]